MDMTIGTNRVESKAWMKLRNDNGEKKRPCALCDINKVPKQGYPQSNLGIVLLNNQESVSPYPFYQAIQDLNERHRGMQVCRDWNKVKCRVNSCQLEKGVCAKALWNHTSYRKMVIRSLGMKSQLKSRQMKKYRERYLTMLKKACTEASDTVLVRPRKKKNKLYMQHDKQSCDPIYQKRGHEQEDLNNMFRKGQKAANKKVCQQGQRCEEDHKGRQRIWIDNISSSTEKDRGNQHMDSLYMLTTTLCNITPQC